MNFASLEYFETLAQERSFTKASERLHITQQSLSSHIAKLEKELGCQLVVRHVPLELTYAGEVFLNYASSLRDQYTTMRHEFLDISKNDEGILRVGIAFTRGRTILPDIIMAFHEKHPHVRIALVEATNEALRQKLVEGDIDLAIAFFPTSLPGIIMRDFYQEEVVILVLRELFEKLYGDETEERVHRLCEGDYSALEKCPLVLGSLEDIGGRIERSLMMRAGLSRPRIVATSNNSETHLALCIRGAGACLCSETLARGALTEEQLEKLLIIRLGDTARYPICFGYRDKPYQWSIIQEFMDMASEVVNRS
ncbi:MAG: LysR family transcriptional regulator [Eggerthellaceae bacterium]|nr:LysR family transcriptional regulator [Eggerthellaceae bacterium]